MGAPLVSILLPSFNSREFLEARINSVLAQNWTNWEAIVLDSYSSDGTWELFQSIAANDSRFHLHQIPREGFYAALNRGIQLARGEFISFATCDDTMAPEFLALMLKAFKSCRKAGIAACDLLLINRNGDELSPHDLAAYLPAESIDDIFASSTVRTAWPDGEQQRHLNYRRPPHDCLLHFRARSVYYSLTQLLIRTSLAKATEPFDITVGSIADVDWLLRLTNVAGSVHLPKKLATWRFHGDQLSVRQDDSRLHSLYTILERALPAIYRRHYPLLTRNDCASLLLPCKSYLALSEEEVRQLRRETHFRVRRMLLERPIATRWAIRKIRFQVEDVRRLLVPLIFRRARLAPKKLLWSKITLGFR